MEWFIVAAIALGFFFIGVGVGGNVAQFHERQEAIKAGVGRWRVSGKNGQTYFHYGPEES